MTSVVEICNAALLKLGEPAILSLSEERKAAQLCRQRYAGARDAVLRDHPWNCAGARASLAALSEAPAWGYARQYAWPTNCVRINAVEGQEGGDWVSEGRRVLTDLGPPIHIQYNRRVEDPNDFDALFAEALASFLAWQLAESLTQSNSRRDAALKDYSEAKRRAALADAQEGVAAVLPEDSWLEARI